jgi:hypothetical protein
VRGTPAAALAGVVCLLLSRPGHAQVRLSTELSSRKVEVGDRFVLRLRAMSDDGTMPQDPQLKLPAGLSGSGPNVGSQTQMSIVNGQMTQSVGITATWVLTASRPGTFKVGPASVQTSAGRSADRVVTVEVVPQGSLPQAPPPLGGQPFDPFGGMLRGFGRSPFPGFPGFPDMDEPEQEPQLPQLPEEYRIDHALDPIAFLRARAQPRKVVVGQQVTLSVYAYAGRGNFEPGMGSEPSRDDFLAFNLMDPGEQLQGYQFDMNGQRWITVKVQEFALFPLKAGKLKAGEMTFGFRGRSYSKDPQGLERKSAAIEVDVVEPPLAGRPPGYRLGDVGHYTLNANVQPREVPAGGSVAVVAKLEGTGNLPSSLLVPEQRGVHWLEPQIVDQVAPRQHVVQGFRTFTYVVELSQPGEQDLGEITLPYYDVKTRAYGVARASLGTVKVTGTAKPAARDDRSGPVGGPRLHGLVTPPRELGAWSGASPSYLTSRIGFWWTLIGLPVSALVAFTLSDLAKLFGRRLRERRGSLAAALDDALGQLTNAAGRADVATTASAAERALFLSIEKGSGLKARSILKTQLAPALERAGVATELAQRAGALLARCDELRFAGEAYDLRQFATDARETCQKLGATKPNKAVSS